MTEPDDNPTAGFSLTDPVVSAGEDRSVEKSNSDDVVLATREPHTLLLAPDLAITPDGTSVPANKADEYIETGHANGVHVFKKEAN